MNSFLRQSTASQSRSLGPFVDDTDFKTAETALTIANTDIKIIANGGASADKNSGGGTHRANGVYGVTFDATDTATVGEIEISVKVAGALAVFHKFWVLEEAVYDALFAASAPGYLQPTTAGRTLDVSAGGEGGIDWANIGSPTTVQGLSGTTVGTATALTNDPAGVTTLLARLGGFTGSGVNTVLGFMKALLSKAASTPSDVGGTFDASTDSTEAIRDRGDSAWITATGFSTHSASDVWAVGTRTLTSFGTLVSDIWAAVTDSPGVTTLLTRIPSGIFTGITSLAQWLGLIAGKQTGNSTARTEVRATGAGSGTFDETTDSQEALRDRGDSAWTTATGFSTHSAADVWNVATRTLTSFGTLAADVWAAVTRTLTAGTNIALAKGTGVTGFNDLSAAQVNAEADTALADVGVTSTVTGRIDVATSTRATPAQVATELATYDGPTKAELDAAVAPLATAVNLATLDTVADAILAMLDDPRSEPGQGAPPVNPDMATKLDYVYKLARNKITQDATTLKIYADDGTTVDHKATVSDDGSTYTRGELATGP